MEDYKEQLRRNIEIRSEYQAPDSFQVKQIKNIREAAKVFATIVAENTPLNADQSAAIRKIREAVMTANASIVCKL